MIPRRILAVAAIATLAGQVIPQAPAGFKTYENKSAELTFHYPVVYQEVPLPPTEQVLVARFVLRERPRELRKIDERVYKAVEPELAVYRFEKAEPVTGAGAEPVEAGPSTVREAMEEGSRVGSWDEFVARFSQWSLIEDRRREGWFTMKYAGEWPAGLPQPIGFLLRKEEDTVTYGAYGFALKPYEKTFARQFDRLWKSLELADPTASERAGEKIDRIYASGDYSAIELRKAARAALARGWKAYDTENYLIVHHSKRPALIERIGRDIEAMRGFYMELFPPTQPVDQLSIVRVCRTKEEYAHYGGPPGTGGYWHPGNEELVFYDYSETMKQMDADEREALGRVRLSDDDSLLVLYHEAFHQYVHYAVGEFAPHDWFNEGYGDYFSGTEIHKTSGRITGIGPSPWRIHVAKDMCEYGDNFIPLKEILRADRRTFYNRARARYFYAGAWSFVYFLVRSEEAAANPAWSKILPTYYETAKRAYQDALKKFGENPGLDEKEVAEQEARSAALKAALDGVDVDALEAVWKQYVVDMRDPWPSMREKRK